MHDEPLNPPESPLDTPVYIRLQGPNARGKWVIGPDPTLGAACCAYIRLTGGVLMSCFPPFHP